MRDRITYDQGGIVRGPRNERALALMFAGGFFAEGAKTILDALRERGLPASFFLSGDFLRMEQHQTVVECIVADGHYLGPHSDTHPLYCAWDNRATTLITQDRFVTDLEQNLVDLGSYGQSRDQMRYWLPPYEWYNETIAAWSRARSMILLNYTPGTRSHADWAPDHHRAFVPSRAICQSILDYERQDRDGMNGFLLLMHLGAGPERSDKLHHLLASLLDTLLERDYCFVKVNELLKDVEMGRRASSVMDGTPALCDRSPGTTVYTANDLAIHPPQADATRTVPGGYSVVPSPVQEGRMASSLGFDGAAGAVALPALAAVVRPPVLTVRSGPGTWFGSEGQIRQGTMVSCVAAMGAWFKIRTATLDGYVSSRVVRLYAPAVATTIVRGPTGRHAVALTFDAGHDRGFTESILDTLGAKGVKASFGVTGKWAMANSDLVQRIADEGHHLINHSRSHRSFTGASPKTDPLSPAECLHELETTERTLRELTGQGAKPWVRPPYGDADEEILGYVTAIGFRYNVRWTVDSRGWAGLAQDDIVSRVLGRHGNGYIYLFHVGAHSQDGPALSRIIDGLRDLGYALEMVHELVCEKG